MVWITQAFNTMVALPPTKPTAMPYLRWDVTMYYNFLNIIDGWIASLILKLLQNIYLQTLNVLCFAFGNSGSTFAVSRDALCLNVRLYYRSCQLTAANEWLFAATFLHYLQTLKKLTKPPSKIRTIGLTAHRARHLKVLN